GYNLAIMDELNQWGNTAHYVDASIDTGEIIEVDRFPIDAETETAQSLERKTMQALEDFARRIITRAIESKTKLPTTP
ncbi:formyltransferase family protein, partial [Neisseria sp. P0015.S009]